MGSGGRAGGGYYVPFVSGLGLLFSRVSCQAEAWTSTVVVTGNKWLFHIYTSERDEFKLCDL